MKKKQLSPNPNGQTGKPFTLAPMKFDDALRKILARTKRSHQNNKEKTSQIATQTKAYFEVKC